jgi:hypothetical protein
MIFDFIDGHSRISNDGGDDRTLTSLRLPSLHPSSHRVGCSAAQSVAKLARALFLIPRLSGRWHLACGVGSKRLSAMTYKVIALEFVVPTLLAIALAIVLSIGAVHLIDNCLGPIDQAEANYSAAGRD